MSKNNDNSSGNDLLADDDFEPLWWGTITISVSFSENYTSPLDYANEIIANAFNDVTGEVVCRNDKKAASRAEFVISLENSDEVSKVHQALYELMHNYFFMDHVKTWTFENHVHNSSVNLKDAFRKHSIPFDCRCNFYDFEHGREWKRLGIKNPYSFGGWLTIDDLKRKITSLFVNGNIKFPTLVEATSNLSDENNFIYEELLEHSCTVNRYFPIISEQHWVTWPIELLQKCNLGISGTITAAYWMAKTSIPTFKQLSSIDYRKSFLYGYIIVTTEDEKGSDYSIIEIHAKRLPGDPFKEVIDSYSVYLGSNNRDILTKQLFDSIKERAITINETNKAQETDLFFNAQTAFSKYVISQSIYNEDAKEFYLDYLLLILRLMSQLKNWSYISIEELDLSVRTFFTLKKNEILDVESLEHLTQQELERLPRMNTASINEIAHAMHVLGYTNWPRV